MPKHTNATLEAELAEARMRLNVASSDDVLKSLLAPWGLDDDYVERGRDLLADAQSTYDTFVDEKADVSVADDRVAAADRVARRTYVRDLTLARTALSEDDPEYETLELQGERTWDRRTRWTGEARTFYRKLREDASLLDAIAPYPIDVDAGVDALDALEDEVEQRRVETGEAESATDARNAAFDALSGYMSAFLTVAEVALRDVDPQQAEKLNLTVPSTR